MPVCPSCGGTEIDYHDAGGESLCTNCGCILEENTIVSSVQFSESSTGASSVIGQYVSATCSQPFRSRRGGFGYSSQQPREVTLNNGRRKISDLASALSLGSHYIDSAHRVFVLAVQHGFTRGRKSGQVVASCLYTVCRQQKSPHLLIDFADALQINVYVLGSTFLKLCRTLNLRLPIIDPSLYIHRFAARLDLGGKCHAVAMTAMRLVQRMSRDWIQTGRRPAGVCGACLLIAARQHGFDRSRRDVRLIVRVCDDTIRQRLIEFERTPSASLTPAQFETHTLQSECNPPAFTRNREKEAAASLAAHGGGLASSTASAHQRELAAMYAGLEKDLQTVQAARVALDAELKQTHSDLATSLAPAAAAAAAGGAAAAAAAAAAAPSTAPSSQQLGALPMLPQPPQPPPVLPSLPPPGTSAAVSPPVSEAPTTVATSTPLMPPQPPLPPAAGAPVPCTPSATAAAVGDSGDPSDLSDGDDAELDSMILSPEEVRKKTTIWMSMNREYLREKALREEQERRNPKKKRKGPYRKSIGGGSASSAAEAAGSMLKQRRVSTKINYDALKNLFGESATGTAAATGTTTRLPTTTPAMAKQAQSATASAIITIGASFTAARQLPPAPTPPAPPAPSTAPSLPPAPAPPLPPAPMAPPRTASPTAATTAVPVPPARPDGAGSSGGSIRAGAGLGLDVQLSEDDLEEVEEDYDPNAMAGAGGGEEEEELVMEHGRRNRLGYGDDADDYDDDDYGGFGDEYS